MRAIHLALVSFAGGNASTVTGPLEVLQFASTQMPAGTSLRVSVITPDGGAVNCGGCVTITPIGALADLADADIVFLAGMPCDIETVVRDGAAVMPWLREQLTRGVALATVCPTQALLAAAGLLHERTVAMHWSLIGEAQRRWPRTRWTAERMVVEDQGLYSCCGASAATDLALYLVDRYCGHDVMASCAQWFLADPPRVRQRLPPPLFSGPVAESTDMAAVESWMLGHFHESVHFETLAVQFGMSWRTFYRRFQETFGVSPKTYLQKLRLNAARALLEGDNAPIEQVASRVGYLDAAFFRTLFKRHVGMTPSRYRDNFRFRPLLRDEGGTGSVMPPAVQPEVTPRQATTLRPLRTAVTG